MREAEAVTSPGCLIALLQVVIACALVVAVSLVIERLISP